MYVVGCDLLADMADDAPQPDFVAWVRREVPSRHRVARPVGYGVIYTRDRADALERFGTTRRRQRVTGECQEDTVAVALGMFAGDAFAGSEPFAQSNDRATAAGFFRIPDGDQALAPTFTLEADNDVPLLETQLVQCE